MESRTQVEQQIGQVVADATSAVSLSNQLFAPGGLFSQLASTEQERRALIKTPLYKEAKRRISSLRKTEAREFSETVRQYEKGRGELTTFQLEKSPSN